MLDFVETKHKVLEEVIVKNKELEEKQIILDKMAKIKYSIILLLFSLIGNFKKLIDVIDKNRIWRPNYYYL
jgi:hypothetical protein